MLNETEIKTGVDPGLLQLLVCPMTRNSLEHDAQAQELISRLAGLAFPIRNDVPILLLQEARRLSDD